MAAVKRVPITKARRAKLLEVARDHYEDNDCDVEIDDNAKMHHNGDTGYWVQAWVYVAEEYIDGEPDGEQ